jgi:hypothetical protein
MRLNSVFIGFFNNRLAVGPGVAIVVLTIFLTASSFTEHSDRDLRAKQVNLIIRQIGHRLLLQAGDSTSRVLPVNEIKEGTFLLEFESEFVFNHDSLMVLSQDLLPKTQFTSGYTVTVHECMKTGIVYGFQVSNTSPDILACSGRSQPPGCYTIEFAFPGFYENVEQKKADIDLLTEELKSVDPQKTNQKPEEFKTTTFDYPLSNLVYSAMLVLLGVALLIGRFRKSLTPVPVQNQDQAIIKESVPELPALGKFLFDVKDQRLLLKNEVISLTDKEYQILELLSKNFGELIPRETLMQEVWINEGVITGRSLDMFVSKLRKKLSGDPELRITNVHGKGYKLEIPAIQIL